MDMENWVPNHRWLSMSKQLLWIVFRNLLIVSRPQVWSILILTVPANRSQRSGTTESSECLWRQHYLKHILIVQEFDSKSLSYYSEVLSFHKKVQLGQWSGLSNIIPLLPPAIDSISLFSRNLKSRNPESSLL